MTSTRCFTLPPCASGDVNKDLGNGMFNVKLENGVTVMAHLSGKVSSGGDWVE